MPFDQSVPDRGTTADPVLLDDRQMRDFVTRGYLTFRLDLPDAFHRRVRERALEDIRRCEEAGIRSPLNNALPRIPELRRVFDHPRVAGALTSILGAGYYLHLHRHVHDNRPGSDAQTITRTVWATAATPWTATAATTTAAGRWPSTTRRTRRSTWARARWRRARNT